MVDAQDGHVRPLEVRDDADGERGLDEPGHEQVRPEHRRHGLREMERRVQRYAVRVLEQVGLDPELDGGAQGGGIDPDVATDARGEGSAGRRQRRVAGQDPVDRVADHGHDERHVEAVRRVREHAAVAEEQRLDQQAPC